MRTLLNPLSVSLALAIGVGAPSLAEAQPIRTADRDKKPSKKDLRKAKEAYKRGAKLQADGLYSEAIAAYTEALELTGSTALHFNIGQAYRLWGKKTEALAAYRRYLDAEPEGQAAPEAYGHIQALEAQLREAEEAVERERAEAEAKKARLAAERTRQEQAEERARQEAAYGRLVAKDALERKRAGRYQLAGLATAGTGVVIAAAGAFFHSKAASKEDEIARAEGAWSAELDQAIEDGEAADRNAVIFYSLGGAALAAGATLYLVGEYMKPQKRESFRVDATATGSSASASLTWTF